MGRIAGSSGPRTLEAIRRVGLRLIYEHGYEAMSLRRLAAEVGIQQGSLYNHIASKQDLLMDLVRGHMTDLLAELDRALAGIKAPLERLEAFAGFHVHYHMTRKQEVSVVNFELRSLEPKYHAEIVKLRRRYEQRLAGIIGDGIASGELAATDVRVASFATLALLTGVCTWYRPRGRLSEADVVALHVRLALDGLRRGGGTDGAAVQQPKRRLRARQKIPG
jgi:AcrR family transcriptional regulator